MRKLTGAGAPVSMLLRTDAPDVREAERGVVILINTSRTAETPPPLDPLPPAAGAPFDGARPIEDGARDALLGAGEVRLFRRGAHHGGRGPRAARTAALLTEALKAPRIAIERITPSVDGGAFPIKRIVGRPISRRSGYRDGRSRHPGRRAVVEGRRREGLDARAARRPSATTAGRRRFAPKRVGRHLYTIEAWRDDYASLVHEISVKHKAGVDIALELTEARQYLEAVNAKAVPCNTTALGKALQILHGDDAEASVQALSAPATVKAVAASAERAFRVQHPPLPLDVERPQAEICKLVRAVSALAVRRRQSPRHVRRRDRPPRRHPRDGFRRPLLPADPSHRREEPQGPQQHADARARRSRQSLCDRQPRGRARCDPSAARHARGFPPARRGGARERAGDRARLRDPVLAGSSVAAASIRTGSSGGRTARSSTPRTRRRSIRTSSTSISTAAIRPACGPRCATSCCSGPSKGVRIFRVDNPHTKPLPFWQWMIADVRARYPDVIFLSEAFTRPKMMYRLAKVGFSQSYTYFTWRNTKQELDRLSDRADHDRGEGILPAALLRQHARHQSVLPADLRPARLSHPRGARRNAVRPVGRLFGLRTLRGRAAARPRGISRLREVRDPRPRPERARQHRRRDHARSIASARRIRRCNRISA